MEHLYWWSLATFLWSGWQVIRQGLSLNSYKLEQFKRVLAYQVLYFLRNEYKLTILLLISVMAMAFTGSFVKEHVLETFFWTNVVWWLFQIVIRDIIESPLYKAKIASFLRRFLEGSPLSLFAVWGAILINTFLLILYRSFFGNICLLIALLSCTFLATGTVLGAFRLWQYRWGLHPAPLKVPHLSNEKFEVWLISLLASLCLAQVYGVNLNFFLLPISLSIGMGASMLLLRSSFLNLKMLGVFSLQVAYLVVCTYIFLPESWMKNGISYTRIELLHYLLGVVLVSISFVFAKNLFRKYNGKLDIFFVLLVIWQIIAIFRKLDLYGAFLGILLTLSVTCVED